MDLGPGASPDLAWVAGTLWDDLPGIGVSMGEVPPGRAAVESYRVVPSARAPRLLIPMDRRAAWAAARDGGATRSARASFERSLTGLVGGAGAGGLTFRDRLTVHAEPGAEGRTLSAILGQAVGDTVRLAVNVRPPGPYRKPVAQLIGPGGRILAYAKVSWNDLTETNVRAESGALRMVAASGVGLGAPEVLAETAWKGRTVLLTKPMPAGLRRFGSRRAAPDAALVGAVAAMGGLSEAPLGGEVLDRLRDRLRAASGALPEVAEALGDLLDAIRGDVQVPVGLWHGDWSPWNLGLEGRRLWAWDWEYSRSGVPVGLDVPHFHFQSAFIGHRRELAAAFDHARGRAEAPLASLGLDRRAVGAVLAVHAAEVGLRYLEAEARGAKANPRFLAEGVPVLRSAADRAAGRG